MDRNPPARLARKGLRYSSDLTGAEWAVLEPLLPRRSRLGRPAKWPFRTIADAMLCLLRSGQPWRMLPGDFPPVTTVQRYLYAWRDRGLWSTINPLLLMAVATRRGAANGLAQRRGDRQPSVKTTESGGPCRYDAGKKVKGRKRHILTDPGGLLVAAQVHTAEIQDCDGAPALLVSIRHSFPLLRHVFADGGYAGDKPRDALAGRSDWKIEIIKRSDAAKGLVLLPRRSVVERTLAWLGRDRRLANDFEKTVESSTAWLFMASVQLMTHRLANA